MPPLAPAEQRPRLTTLGNFILYLDSAGRQNAVRGDDVTRLTANPLDSVGGTHVHLINNGFFVSYNPITDWLEILVYGSEASNG